MTSDAGLGGVGLSAYAAASEAILGLSRPFLHARWLSFSHPVGGHTVQADSPLPPDLAEVLESLN